MNTNSFKSRTLGIILSIAVIFSMVAVTVPATPVQATTTSTWYVAKTGDDTTGTGTISAPWLTIQHAIDTALSGDTINVAAGIYNESITINKQLSLIGSNKTTTIIDGSSTGVVVTITTPATGIIFRSFTVRNSGSDPLTNCGIGLQGVSGCTIEDNIVTNNVNAIVLTSASSSNTVRNNTVSSSAAWGVILYAGPGFTDPDNTNNTISGNTITGSGNSGIYVDEHSDSNIISSNSISGSTGAPGRDASGIFFFHSDGNTVTGNTISNNHEYGVELHGPCENNIFTGNSVTGNLLGGFKVGAAVITPNTLTYNNISSNNSVGIFAEAANTTTNAIKNWWGQNTTPAAQISGPVNYTPWLQVAVTAPISTTCVKGGTNYMVGWTAYSVPDATASFQVYNGTGWVDVDSVTGTFAGTYSTSIAMPSVNSSSCKVRVTISGGDGPTYYAESGTFRIDNMVPTVSLGAIASCLKGGSTAALPFIVGDTGYTTQYNYTVKYNPTYTVDNWTTIASLSDQTTGTKSVSWTVPYENSSNCKWRVTATDCAGNTYTATSTNTFIIDSIAPTVILTDPLGGQTLTAGGTYTVSFTGGDALSSNLIYTIRYTTDGGTNWIGSPSENTTEAVGARTRAWTVPLINSSTVRLGVWTTDCAGNTSAVSASNSNVSISSTSAPTVAVIAPNGGESWAAGSTQTVRWTATDVVAGNFTNIRIYYTFNYPTENCTWENPVGGIGSYAQGAGNYSWTVPTPLATSTTCRLKVAATDAAGNIGSDISNANFTIVLSPTAPTVAVISPNGGETLQGGTCQTITWTAIDPSDSTWLLTYLLEYYNGSSWVSIATLTNRDQGTQSYRWSVPTTGAATYLVRVSATGPGGTGTDQSDAAFTVAAADSAVTTAIITLKPGWNLISLQLMPTCVPSTTTSTTGYPIECVMADALARVGSVWYFTGGTSGSWQSWAPGAPSSLFTMTDGKAYWVYVTSGVDVTFTYQGRKGPAGGGFPTTPYTYVAGWNMVGFKSTVAKSVSTYLGGTCGTTYVAPIWGWNATSQAWTSPECSENLTPGSGYFVDFNTSHTVNAGAF